MIHLRLVFVLLPLPADAAVSPVSKNIISTTPNCKRAHLCSQPDALKQLCPVFAPRRPCNIFLQQRGVACYGLSLATWYRQLYSTKKQSVCWRSKVLDSLCTSWWTVLLVHTEDPSLFPGAGGGHGHSKISLNGGRVPYYTDLSEIKTLLFLKSGDSVPHLTSDLKAYYTLYSSSCCLYFSLFKNYFNFGKLLWDSLYAKEPKASSCLRVRMCHRPGPPSALHLTYVPHMLSCDQIKERVGLFHFVLSEGSSASPWSTARHLVTQQILLSGYIVFAMVNLSAFLYICVAASDPFVNTSNNPDLLEVKIDMKDSNTGLKSVSF